MRKVTLCCFSLVANKGHVLQASFVCSKSLTLPQERRLAKVFALLGYAERDSTYEERWRKQYIQIVRRTVTLERSRWISTIRFGSDCMALARAATGIVECTLADFTFKSVTNAPALKRRGVCLMAVCASQGFVLT